MILDSDGVPVDTEQTILNSWTQLFAREGQAFPGQGYFPCLRAGYTRQNHADLSEHKTDKHYDRPTENARRQAEIEHDLTGRVLTPGARSARIGSGSGIRLHVASSSSRPQGSGRLSRFDALHFSALRILHSPCRRIAVACAAESHAQPCPTDSHPSANHRQPIFTSTPCEPSRAPYGSDGLRQTNFALFEKKT